MQKGEKKMTNQQAINLLKVLEQSLDDYCELNDEGKTAFRMAIEALEVFGNSEQLPSAQPDHSADVSKMVNGDVVSRREAIQTTLEFIVEYLSGAFDENLQKKLIERMNALPSVQPEIIHCKDCKWKNQHNCTRAVELFIDDDKYCAWAERREE